MPVKKSIKKAVTQKPANSSSSAKSLSAIAKKQTKTQIFSSIAESVAKSASLTKKDVAIVFVSLAEHIFRHMKTGGSGEFTIPEAGIRVKRKIKPATKKRTVINPATGKETEAAAKPARTVVKIIPLRILKDSV